MNYIVFDLEFNMFFKFKEGDSAHSDLKNEIIQIGAVKLNEKLENVGEFSLLVKPVIYKRMNPFVKRKTNISTSRIVKGTPFVKAIESFKSWIGNEYVLCSWGHDDILALHQNCLFFGFDSLSFNKYINIQQIYMKLKSLTNQPSLESVVEGLEITIKSPFHDALSDASYTSDIFRKVYDFSWDAVTNWEKEQKESEERIAELTIQMDKANICCPNCGGFVVKNKEINKRKRYFAFGYCPQCNIPIRHVSRIAHKDGDYHIITHNSIYKPDKIENQEL